jgi:eukaryotic-like serine/threonine-protein kinase
MVGEVIEDRFEIVRLIGSGGGGAVFEVMDRTSEQPAALKMLVAEDKDLAARLVREGKALSLVAHPNLVALVDAGETADGTPYVVTELVNGRSLREVLDTETIPPRRALAIVRQLLEALNCVHDAGMIHRDIKPENIMLADGGQPGRDYVRLLDFGAAKIVDPSNIGEGKLTRAGLEVFGSPPYIAPETAIGEPIDGRTDLYSVGIVLYELLAGRVPFEHEDATTLLRMHVTDPPPPLHAAAPDREILPELERVVQKALAKVPDQRYATALDMHAAVENAAHVLETAPPRPQVQRAASRPSLPPAPARAGIGSRARELASGLGSAMLRHPRTAAIVGVAVVLVVVLAVALRGSSTAAPVAAKGGSGSATSAAAGSGAGAAALAAHPTDAAGAKALVAAADAVLAKRDYTAAVSAYERALAADRALGGDANLRVHLAQIGAKGDAVSATVALELESHLEPPDTKTIAWLAATAKQPAVRHRAYAIAERDGFAGTIDRLASWTLDLRQPASCDDRKETIAKLVTLGDKRAIDALQKASAQACIATEANAAIAQLQAKP